MNYYQSVKEIRRLNAAVGDDQTITKSHEIYFKTLLDNETRQFTNNQDRNKYLDNLEHDITDAWSNKTDEYREQVLSNLMVRLSTQYRTYFDGTPSYY